MWSISIAVKQETDMNEIHTPSVHSLGQVKTNVYLHLNE